MTLEELRNQIDALDRQLVELLSERARAAQRIGHLKAATSLPVYEPGREKVIYANVRAANKGPLPDIELTHIYERIIDVMRALQRTSWHQRGMPMADTERQGQGTGGNGRPRQGTSNDCSDAGEGHRRTDRCSHRGDGGVGRKCPPNHGSGANDSGGVGPTAGLTWPSLRCCRACSMCTGSVAVQAGGTRVPAGRYGGGVCERGEDRRRTGGGDGRALFD